MQRTWPFWNLLILTGVLFIGRCDRTAAIRIRQPLPGAFQVSEILTLHLIDAKPAGETEWAAEAARLQLRETCPDWNNAGVYRALLALRAPDRTEQLQQRSLPLLEKAVRLCQSDVVDENYRTVFVLAGSRAAQSRQGDTGP